MFLGYSINPKGYKCYDPANNKTYYSRHVKFNEHVYPCTNHPNPSVPFTISVYSPSATCELPISNINTSQSPDTSPNSNANNTDASSHHMKTRSKSGIFKPSINYHHCSSNLYTTSSTKNYTAALQNPIWHKAMNEDFNALLYTDTWILVPPNNQRNIIGYKWVFKVKQKANNTLDRCKARLVAKDFHQTHGLDYTETLSPVDKPTTIRLILSVATYFNWTIKQFNIHNAFLLRSLTEDVYMQQPPGFVHPNFPTYLCKLNKSLYGLKGGPKGLVLKACLCTHSP